jgi:hypothetical protein
MFHQLRRKPDRESNFAVINRLRQWLEHPPSTCKGYEYISDWLITNWSTQIITIQIGHKVQNKILPERNLVEYIIAMLQNYTNFYRVANNFSKDDKGLLKLQTLPKLNSTARTNESLSKFTRQINGKGKMAGGLHTDNNHSLTNGQGSRHWLCKCDSV